MERTVKENPIWFSNQEGFYTYQVITVASEGEEFVIGYFTSDHYGLETYDEKVPYCFGSNQYIECLD